MCACYHVYALISWSGRMPAVFVHVVASATRYSGCLCRIRVGSQHVDISLIVW